MTIKPLHGAGDMHLDDEALSAVLDGEAEVDETAHADACDVCRARLAALGDASTLVGTPAPPPDPARREAAIAAALGAGERTADVVRLRPRRTAPAWLAAAAVIAAAVVGISLLPSTGGDDDDTATSAGDSAADAADGGDDAVMSDAVPETAFAMAAPYDGGDLGTIDVGTLREQVEDGIANSQGEVAADEDASAATGGATETTVANRAMSCEPGLRTTYPDLGNLVYTASGMFDGDAMVVLGFDVGPDRWVFVVAAADCGDIRNQQTYSR